MNTAITQPLSTTEQKLLQLTRLMSPEHLSAVLDFAEFLATKSGESQADEFEETPPGAGDEQWEKALARPEAKRLLREMAREVLEDYHAGRVTDITMTDDGELAPA